MHENERENGREYLKKTLLLQSYISCEDIEQGKHLWRRWKNMGKGWEKHADKYETKREVSN